MSIASRVRWFPAGIAAVVAAAVAVPVALLVGCGGAARSGGAARAGAVTPGAPVNPRACGQAATSTELGRRMQRFLAATVALEAEIAATETALHNACGLMGRDLGLAPPQAASTLAVCSAVAFELHLAHARPVQSPKQPDDTGRVAGAHLPGIARLRTRAAGPLQTELRTWGRTAADLVAAGPGPLRPLGSRAACVFDQLVIAAARLAVMQASLTVQLEASAAIQSAARIPLG
jgi:hypothetical protein